MTAEILPFKQTDRYREPPGSPEAERALLGAVILYEDVLQHVAPVVLVEHFVVGTHAIIFDTIQKLIQAGQPVTQASLKVYLGDSDLGGITTQEYIRQCVLSACSPAGAKYDAAMIRDLYLRRQAISIANDLIEQSYDLPVDTPVEQMLGNFESAVEQLRPSRNEQRDYDLFETASNRAVDMATLAYQRDGRLVGLSTGLDRLDDAVGGLQPSDLVVLAGRPGMGKSALAAGIAVAVARELQAKRLNGQRTGVVAFNSLEMGAEQLCQRVLAEQSDVSAWRLRRGMADEKEFMAFVDAARDMRTLPLRIDETGGLTIGQLSIKVRSLHKRAGVEMLVVDYLQLMRGGPQKRERNRVEEVTEITAGLKALAKELKIPIVAVSQLSRNVESRDDRRPILADLRESGSIEQDADIVMFVYRDEYYVANGAEPQEGSLEQQEWKAKLDEVSGRAEVIIAKHRHGPIRTVKLGYDARLTRFINDPPDVQPVEKNKKRKAVLKLSKEATTAFGILRSLTMTRSLPNTGDVVGIPRSAKPVSYLLWRQKCAEQLLDNGNAQDEKFITALMQSKVVPWLQAAELIQRGGKHDDPLCWLTDKGMA